MQAIMRYSGLASLPASRYATANEKHFGSGPISDAILAILAEDKRGVAIRPSRTVLP